jgi:hypothetical protein
LPEWAAVAVLLGDLSDWPGTHGIGRTALHDENPMRTTKLARKPFGNWKPRICRSIRKLYMTKMRKPRTPEFTAGRHCYLADCSGLPESRPREEKDGTDWFEEKNAKL